MLLKQFIFFRKDAFHEDVTTTESDEVEQKRNRYFSSIPPMDRTTTSETRFFENLKRTIM